MFEMLGPPISRAVAFVEMAASTAWNPAPSPAGTMTRRSVGSAYDAFGHAPSKAARAAATSEAARSIVLN